MGNADVADLVGTKENPEVVTQWFYAIPCTMACDRIAACPIPYHATARGNWATALVWVKPSNFINLPSLMGLDGYLARMWGNIRLPV